MPKKQESPEQREAQFMAFVEASREQECDQDPNVLRAAVRTIARASGDQQVKQNNDD